LRECAGQISDEVLRRHYFIDLRERLTALFGRTRPVWQPRNFVKNNGNKSDPTTISRVPMAPSSRLLQSSIFAARPEAPPLREVFILALLLNHPGLLSLHDEDIAWLEFSSDSASRLRDALIGLVEPDLAPQDLREKLLSSGFQSFLDGLATNATILTLWCVRPDAHENDADEALRQALALHRKQRALNRELRLAETVLAEEPSEANFAVLADIRAQLSALEGAEATVEGYGLQSGREDKSV